MQARKSFDFMLVSAGDELFWWQDLLQAHWGDKTKGLCGRKKNMYSLIFPSVIYVYCISNQQSPKNFSILKVDTKVPLIKILL